MLGPNEVSNDVSGVADGIGGEWSRVFSGDGRTQAFRRLTDGKREGPILLNPVKMRQGIPAKRPVRLFRQPDIIGKRHCPSRTDPRPALITDLPSCLGCCEFLLD